MDQVKIGNFIAELRKEKELTQERPRERIRVTSKNVSRWENGWTRRTSKKNAYNNLVAALNNNTFTLKESGAFMLLGTVGSMLAILFMWRSITA